MHATTAFVLWSVSTSFGSLPPTQPPCLVGYTAQPCVCFSRKGPLYLSTAKYLPRCQNCQVAPSIHGYMYYYYTVQSINVDFINVLHFKATVLNAFLGGKRFDVGCFTHFSNHCRWKNSSSHTLSWNPQCCMNLDQNKILFGSLKTLINVLGLQTNF